MDIIGFTMVRNARLLDYPLEESVRSMLPICTEVVVNVCESEDDTLQIVQSIGDPKLVIIESPWDENLREGGRILSWETNRALTACEGDWGLYLQADEVLHEDDLEKIEDSANKHVNNPQIEGLLFDYIHFFGGYDFYQKSREWYRREVRVVRLGIGVQSFGDAQGFRLNGRKLHVALSGGRIFHYGWVRRPQVMGSKYRELDRLYHDDQWLSDTHPQDYQYFDYGQPDNLARFTGTHPRVMEKRIAEAPQWLGRGVARHEHDRLWVRALTWLEANILGFRIGEYRNYILHQEE